MPCRRRHAFALVGLLLTACTKPPTTLGVQAAREPDALLVSTHLEGITAPCGCTSRPLGGLDRIAHLVETAKLPWVLAGNTLMTEREPKPALQGYVRVTAHMVAGIVAKLQPVGIAYGPWDVGPMAATLDALPDATRSNLFLAPKGGSRALTQLPRSGHRLTLSGVGIGIIEAPPLPPVIADLSQGHSKANSISFAAQDSGTSDAVQAESGHGPDDIAAALDREARALLLQGAQGVVVLWPHGIDQARALLGALEAVDVVVAGSEEAPQPPETLGSATLLDGGARGEYVGRLTVHAGKSATKLAFFDGGNGARTALTAQRERYLKEAERLPEGPGKQARLARAEALHEELEAIPTTPPKGPYITWALTAMDQHLPQALWATQALSGYNKALCESALADTAARTCAEPPSPQSVYVGTATCQACHQEAFAVWEKTAHSRAWATLERVDKTCDLSCVGCHVVGYEQPGGFCHLADAEPFHNVGCESCHGPGLGHVQNPNDPAAWAETFVRNTPEATCKGCHNTQHSDQFNFATYRPQILGPGHGLPSAP